MFQGVSEILCFVTRLFDFEHNLLLLILEMKRPVCVCGWEILLFMKVQSFLNFFNFLNCRLLLIGIWLSNGHLHFVCVCFFIKNPVFFHISTRWIWCYFTLCYSLKYLRVTIPFQCLDQIILYIFVIKGYRSHYVSKRILEKSKASFFH